MGKTPEFSVFLDRVGDPVNLGVTPNGLVECVDEDDLKVLIGRVLMPMLLNFLTSVPGVWTNQDLFNPINTSTSTEVGLQHLKLDLNI
jgi:hypothetical protein